MALCQLVIEPLEFLAENAVNTREDCRQETYSRMTHFS